MKIDPVTQQEIINALNIIRVFVEQLEPQKGCDSCMYFDVGCKLANRLMPPAHVLKEGCGKWEIFLTPPF